MHDSKGIIRTVLGALAVVFAIPASGQNRQVATDPWHGADPHAFPAVTSNEAAFGGAARIAREGRADGLVVIVDGQTVFERYWNGKTASDVQQMYSATKSPFAFLVGRAISKGCIKSLDQPIVEWVPELVGQGREVLTFRNIMAMESGLAQSRAMDENDARMGRSQLEAVLSRTVEKEPFTGYQYNNAGYRLLFTALERASGKTIPEFSREELFAPLGMDGAYWMEHRAGDIVTGYQSIRMRPRDLAKVAQVMLNGGKWGGKRYLSKRYVAQMMKAPAPQVNPSYGLFWHLNSGSFYLSYYDSDRFEGNLMPGTPKDAIANYGSRGQLIVAVPSLKLVWVRTGQSIPSTIWERDGHVTALSAAIVSAARAATGSRERKYRKAKY